MDNEFEIPSGAKDRIVYIRPIALNDLPEEVQEQAMDAKDLVAVHNSDGEQLALVDGRRLAFILAREHDFEPVSIH
ncbi:hypothetical protein PSA7680_03489 [Pseudoruegeria aquimaris]|uniref:DUF1150 domain-containing protein n=1 Tax=Pseudoruegeria aquimaris TaxID=393663 RepID=A0A1Y5TKI1_9RHOB|nr:DUF1150 family protein [Pseudoruegeria aquimaris]SLN66088.1 hypothetical protein PSA7680_03489 [Pseudoruegeria aquimaris]